MNCPQFSLYFSGSQTAAATYADHDDNEDDETANWTNGYLILVAAFLLVVFAEMFIAYKLV